MGEAVLLTQLTYGLSFGHASPLDSHAEAIFVGAAFPCVWTVGRWWSPRVVAYELSEEVYQLFILSKQDHCASRVKKRGLHGRQYIGPLYPCPTLGRGAVSVFALVPHPEQVPHWRVSSGTTGCAGCARLVVSTVSPLLAVGRVPGCSNTCGATSLSDTHSIN